MESLISPTSCPVFVGRAAEHAALYDLLDRARHGSGQTAIVRGDAGIGKSRLLAEINSDAVGMDFVYLEGKCYESDSALPYAPLLELTREYLARRSAYESTHASQFTGPLARLLPEWRLDPSAGEAAPVDKWSVFVTITRWITELAARSPVLLVIEDIHWGDDLTLEYLLYLARRTRHTPLALLMTVRADEATPATQRLITQLERERLAHELALAPFTQAEVREMVAALLPASGRISNALLETLYTFSEGNPFFIEELLRTLVTSNSLTRVNDIWQCVSANSPVPRSMQETVRQRTEGLSVEARRALDVTAVAGRKVEYRLLRAVLGQDDESLVTLLKELIATHLLIEEYADRYAFPHALIREAVYGELLGRERAAIHRIIGDAIEALWPEGPQRETYLPDLVAHFSAGGDWVKALAYAERATAQALRLHAPRAAIEHASHAEEAAGQLGLPLSADMVYLCGQAHDALGEFELARARYEQALALARAADAHLLESQCMLALGFLWTGRGYGQAGEWFGGALRLAERAGDDALLARSLNRYGNWLANTGRISESLEAHQRALCLFTTLQDQPGRAASLDLLGITCGMTGDRVAATDYLSEAIELFRIHGDPQSLCTSLAMRAIQSAPGSSETVCCALRPPEECLNDATGALELARQMRSPTAEAFAENALAHTLLAFGEYGAAFTHLQAGQNIAREIEHQQWIVATTYGLGLLYADLGATESAIAELTHCQDLAHDLGSAFWTATIAARLGLAQTQHGDLGAAVATLQRALPADQPPVTVAERGVALAWGWVQLAQGEPLRALTIAEQLLASVPGKATDEVPQSVPHVLLLRGEALLALGRMQEAVQALEAARYGAIQRHARPLLWTIHRALDRAYRGQSRHEAARREQFAARELIEVLAATIEDAPLRERFQHMALASLPRDRALSATQNAKQTFGGLTTREREVAVLIARGATSGEIARTLTISERTAETHVSHILGKLGFRSRSQIAAWAVEKGLIQA